MLYPTVMVLRNRNCCKWLFDVCRWLALTFSISARYIVCSDATGVHVCIAVWIFLSIACIPPYPIPIYALTRPLTFVIQIARRAVGYLAVPGGPHPHRPPPAYVALL